MSSWKLKIPALLITLAAASCAPEQEGESTSASSESSASESATSPQDLHYIELDQFQELPRTLWTVDESRRAYTMIRALSFKGICSGKLWGVQVFKDSATQGAPLQCNSREFKWTTAVSQDGNYIFEFRPLNQDGSIAGTSVFKEVVVDTIPPSAPIIVTNEGADIKSDSPNILLEGLVDADVTRLVVTGGDGTLIFDGAKDEFDYTLTLQDGESRRLTFVAYDFVGHASDPTSITISYLAKRVLAMSTLSGSTVQEVPRQSAARARLTNVTLTPVIRRKSGTSEQTNIRSGILDISEAANPKD